MNPLQTCPLARTAMQPTRLSKSGHKSGRRWSQPAEPYPPTSGRHFMPNLV